jgi:predicted transcriptional regulator of viral defense system
VERFRPFTDTTNEIDYVYLLSLLSQYKHPRGKINQLLKSGVLQRVKKGVYIRPSGPYSKMVLANMIYGPSYVSQESALSHYGLIPERVYTVTSMTSGRKKLFRTPVGEFSYDPLPTAHFAVGIRREALDARRGFLIATPEKALCDRMRMVTGIENRESLQEYLEADLRLDESWTQQLSITRLREISRVTKAAEISLLIQLLQGKKAQR